MELHEIFQIACLREPSGFEDVLIGYPNISIGEMASYFGGGFRKITPSDWGDKLGDYLSTKG